MYWIFGVGWERGKLGFRTSLPIAGSCWDEHVLPMESRWMLKCLFSMYMNLVVGDLAHAWYFDCGRCSTPPYLLAINFTIPRYIWRTGHGSLSACVSCSLSVVELLGSKENASMPKVLWEVAWQGYWGSLWGCHIWILWVWWGVYPILDVRIRKEYGFRNIFDVRTNDSIEDLYLYL